MDVLRLTAPTADFRGRRAQWNHDGGEHRDWHFLNRRPHRDAVVETLRRRARTLPHLNVVVQAIGDLDL